MIRIFLFDQLMNAISIKFFITEMNLLSMRMHYRLKSNPVLSKKVFQLPKIN